MGCDSHPFVYMYSCKTYKVEIMMFINVEWTINLNVELALKRIINPKGSVHFEMHVPSVTFKLKPKWNSR